MAEKPIIFSTPMVSAILQGRKTATRRAMKQPPDPDSVSGKYPSERPQTRKYQLGDTLWVRETFAETASGYRFKINADGSLFQPDGTVKWRPAIYLPRAAARIFLKITAVRFEQVKDITEQQAKAEGVASRAAFLDLWDELNAKRGYGHAVNPWVAVIEFKRLSCEEC